MEDRNSTRLPASWPWALRITFRFNFSYLTLYFIDPTGEGLLTHLSRALGVHRWVSTHVGSSWQATVVWIAEQVTGVPVSSYKWTDVACKAVVAFLVTLVWSWMDQRRTHYATLHDRFHRLCRLSLALAMIPYAATKAIPVQFRFINYSDLLARFGDQTPQMALWRFMQVSPGYTSACGLVELLGMILLLSPRTALLGALTCAAAMANVVALNVFYEVGVLIPSMHMLLMSLVLIAPDARRLLNLLLLHRVVPAAQFPRLFRRHWVENAAVVVKYGAFLVFLAMPFRAFQHARSGMIAAAESQPLAGIWDVEEQRQDGQPLPPIASEPGRWKVLVMERTRTGPVAIVHPMKGDLVRYRLGLDEKAKTIRLSRFQPEPKAGDTLFPIDAETGDPPTSVFAYQEVPVSKLTLTGSFEGRPFDAQLQRVGLSNFRLTRRGLPGLPAGARKE